MGFSIDYSSLLAYKARIEAAIMDAPIYASVAADAVAEKLVEQLQEDAPFDGAANNGVLPNEEGHLRDSFGMNDADPGEQATAEVWTNEPIKFGYVTQGTASPIFPVEKMVMWWPDAMHPTPWVSGQAANPFHEKSKDYVETFMDQIVDPVIRVWLGDL